MLAIPPALNALHSVLSVRGVTNSSHRRSARWAEMEQMRLRPTVVRMVPQPTVACRRSTLVDGGRLQTAADKRRASLTGMPTRAANPSLDRPQHRIGGRPTTEVRKNRRIRHRNQTTTIIPVLLVPLLPPSFCKSGLLARHAARTASRLPAPPAPRDARVSATRHRRANRHSQTTHTQQVHW